MAGDRVQHLRRSAGCCKDEGPARVLDGNFVLMDIAAAQLAFDRLGRIDRLDVRLRGADGADVDAGVERRRSRPGCPTGWRRSGRRGAGEQVERMLAAFHLNLTALSYVALLVGLFLVYNTVSISVIARREEIGTLRALGVTRAAGAGAVPRRGRRPRRWRAPLLGIGLGRVLADARRRADVARPSARSTSRPPRRRRRWRGWHVALAFAIGVPLSLLAAALPALEAAACRRRRPCAAATAWRRACASGRPR